ncbi:MAG: hypothetical protein RL088_3772 [Verrucomicrobiota bacterium]|jgi:hypothetical protein
MLNLFRRWRIAKAFGRYISPEAARKIADTPTDFSNVHQRVMNIVLVAIPPPDSATYSGRAGLAADIALKLDGVIYSLLPIVVASFELDSSARTRFISDVQDAIPEASIVHGNVTVGTGIFGSRTRFDFGPWWPGLLDALRVVTTLSPGEIRELT